MPTAAAADMDAEFVAEWRQPALQGADDAGGDARTDIDRVIGGDTWVGSSSSGLGASLYTKHVACRARCLVAHPLNPPYLASIVELVPSAWTTPETMTGVKHLMESVGQSPIVLSREIEGFALNRLQAVLLMEAWRLAEQGIASTADIDKVVSEGLGLRWSFMGPFETINLNAPGGVADYARRLGPLYQSIAAETSKHEVWTEPLIGRIEAQRRTHLTSDDLASRMAWQDRRLMALASHRAEMDSREKSEPHAPVSND
jgi:L-gulonate 3-dehydrogenase